MMGTSPSLDWLTIEMSGPKAVASNHIDFSICTPSEKDRALFLYGIRMRSSGEREP